MRTLRTVRAPQALGYATGDVVGYSDAGGERYVALASGNARLRFQAEAPSRPMLREANARVLRFDRNELSLSGHMPLEFSLQGAGCRVEQDGRLLPRGADGRYRLPSTEAHGLRIRCS
jgi:hypothetical protein